MISPAAVRMSYLVAAPGRVSTVQTVSGARFHRTSICPPPTTAWSVGAFQVTRARGAAVPSRNSTAVAAPDDTESPEIAATVLGSGRSVFGAVSGTDASA